ncbi:MAG: NAD(P)-binding domain-containing protein [Lachnospiraceae bacterium]|nr:NAD(P)-binding domain-containing protein [Lachnospiraceae bacterium]
MAVRILVTDGMDASAVETLRNDGYEIVEKYYEPDELGAALRDFDCVIIRSATKIKEPQIDAALGGKLKLIIRAGVGVDNIAVAYAESKGITVKNTPNSSSNAVAELAIALLFSCARNISVAGSTMRQQKWEKKAYSKGFELSGKTVGVIGYGRIGRLVGAKAQALGMNVLSMVHRNKPEGVECETMHFVSMDELLAQSDVIVLCAPGGEAPFVSAETLPKMKDGVVIINVSRGKNVVEADLLEALNSGKVKAAGLDVWMDEKNPNWELASHPAVSATPHIGAGTKEAQKKIGKELIQVVEGFFGA